MNSSYGSATVYEILWTVCAMPGFALWLSNLISARRDLVAVQRLGMIDGRLIWAKFAVLQNAAFLSIEATFMVIGIVAMLQGPVSANSSKPTPTGLAITFGLLGTSVLMTFVGMRWRSVSKYILGAARLRAAGDVERSSTVE